MASLILVEAGGCMAFIVYCLPRSRSAWLAHFLNYPFTVPRQPVAHDVAPLCKSIEGFLHAYKEEGMWGAVEIEGMIGWQVIKKEMPELKTVVMRRPLQEVYNSLVMQGYKPNLTELGKLDAILDIISEQSGVYSIKSTDLDAPVVGKWLFEYLLELDFDFDWWYQLSQTNIQINLNDVEDMRPEINARSEAFRADVLDKTRGLNECLN